MLGTAGEVAKAMELEVASSSDETTDLIAVSDNSDKA